MSNVTPIKGETTSELEEVRKAFKRAMFVCLRCKVEFSGAVMMENFDPTLMDRDDDGVTIACCPGCNSASRVGEDVIRIEV